MADSKVDIFSTAMRTEFLNAWYATAEPAPFEAFTQRIPSTARIENYAWMSPVPAIAEYLGHRRVGKISEIKYTVPNVEYDDAFQVLLRDIQDDQTGGYVGKASEMAAKAKLFPGRLVLQKLAAGTSDLCFDGSAFFANSHTIGVGDNLLTGTATGAAGTHKFVVLIHGEGTLKPLVFQDRKAPEFENDGGTPQSKFAKMVNYWIDMECAAAYGHWWNAIHVTYSAKPSITELQTTLGEVEAQFRGFKLPAATATDTAEYVHEQWVAGTNNTTVVCSLGLSNLFRQVLNQATIVQSGAAVTNIYEGWANLVPSGFLGT